MQIVNKDQYRRVGTNKKTASNSSPDLISSIRRVRRRENKNCISTPPVNICQAIEAIFLIPGPNRKIKRIRGKCFGTRPGLIWCRHSAKSSLSLSSFSHLTPQGPHQRSRFGRPVPICILKRAKAARQREIRSLTTSLGVLPGARKNQHQIKYLSSSGAKIEFLYAALLL